jgi:hypothetical protein
MNYKLQYKHTISLGAFEITGTQLIISDPGYDLDTVTVPGLGAVLNNCQSGTWQAEVVIKHFDPPGLSLTSELRTMHNRVTEPSVLIWEKQSDYIGVDYGQTGVYDLAHFHDHALVPPDIKWTFGQATPADPDDLWYSYCCELTGSRREGSILPFGVVTNSGKGDGGYEYSIARDTTGKIVGVWVLFVDDTGKG